MADELIFYTNPMSRGRTVRWMLEEVGAPYETVVLGYGTSMKAPEYLAVNPMGKVPAISHRGTVVTEVSAICAYLADAFPEAGLAPPTRHRADYYRWMFFMAGPFEAALVNETLGVKVAPAQRGFTGYGSYDTVLDTLEAALKGRRYIVGDGFTAADLYVAAYLAFFMGFGKVPERQAFVTYATRITQRPAYLRAAAIDDKLIAEQQRG